MSTYEFVYQTFLVYIFLKSLIFFPLLWVACVYWWSERSKSAETTKPELNPEAPQPSHLPGFELLPQ